MNVLHSSPEKIQTKSSAPSFTILAIDDHHDTLVAIEAILPDYTVLKAMSGEEALRVLLHHHVNLVLLDVRMETMDGIETASLIRKRRETADIPIIFMSAIDKSDQRVFMGYEAGAVDYIFKPFSPAILKAKVSVFRKLFDKTEKLQLSEEQLTRANRRLIENNLRLDATIKEMEREVEERIRAEGRLKALSSELLVAQEKEKRRISYDLHDNAWQNLLAIRFDIENLFSGREDWAALESKSKEVTAEMLSTMAKIRSMQSDLWPSVLDDIGILATIDWYCREFEKSHSGLAFEKITSVTETEIPSHVKIVIYRILQETLNNVAKHSQASRITIRFIKNDHALELTIEDNGMGFDPEETITNRSPWGGAGLLNIKTRTELSGGKLNLESEKGKGTIIRAAWPL